MLVNSKKIEIGDILFRLIPQNDKANIYLVINIFPTIEEYRGFSGDNKKPANNFSECIYLMSLENKLNSAKDVFYYLNKESCNFYRFQNGIIPIWPKEKPELPKLNLPQSYNINTSQIQHRINEIEL